MFACIWKLLHWSIKVLMYLVNKEKAKSKATTATSFSIYHHDNNNSDKYLPPHHHPFHHCFGILVSWQCPIPSFAQLPHFPHFLLTPTISLNMSSSSPLCWLIESDMNLLQSATDRRLMSDDYRQLGWETYIEFLNNRGGGFQRGRGWVCWWIV